MKLLIRAALLAASISNIGSAYAGDRDEPVPNTQYAEISNAIAEAPVQSDRAITGRLVQVVAQQHSGSVFQRAAL